MNNFLKYFFLVHMANSNDIYKQEKQAKEEAKKMTQNLMDDVLSSKNTKLKY